MSKRFCPGYFYIHPPFSFNDEVIFLLFLFLLLFLLLQKILQHSCNANTYVSQRLIFFLISSLCLHNTSFIFCLFREYTVFRQRTSIFRTTKQPKVFYKPFQFLRESIQLSFQRLQCLNAMTNTSTLSTDCTVVFISLIQTSVFINDY